MQNLLTFDSRGIKRSTVVQPCTNIRQSSSYVPLQLCPPHTQSSGSSALCSYTTSTTDSYLQKRTLGAQVEICKDLFIPLRSTESPLLAAGSSKLEPDKAVPMRKGFSRRAVQEPSSAQFHSASPAQIDVSLFSVDLSAASGQVKSASCAVCGCAHAGAHRRTFVHTQNPVSRFRIPALVTWKQV